MNWLFTIVRVVGASFPVASSLVQLNAEMDAQMIQDRLRRLEDPISALHPDVRDVARSLFANLTASGTTPIQADGDFLERYSRPIAILEASGYVQGTHTFGMKFAGGIYPSATFVLYMCALYGDSGKMNRLVERLETCTKGTSLRGADICQDLQLPVPIIRAAFEVYASRGLGLPSKESGVSNYRCMA